MGLKKGMTNNPNGRPLGSKNKKSAYFDHLLGDFPNKGSMLLQVTYLRGIIDKANKVIRDILEANMP